MGVYVLRCNISYYYLGDCQGGVNLFLHVLPSDDFDKTLKDINGSKENADGF